MMNIIYFSVRFRFIFTCFASSGIKGGRARLFAGAQIISIRLFSQGLYLQLAMYSTYKGTFCLQELSVRSRFGGASQNIKFH